MIIEVGKQYWTYSGDIAVIELFDEGANRFCFVGKVIDTKGETVRELCSWTMRGIYDLSSLTGFDIEREYQGNYTTPTPMPVVGNTIDFYISCNADRELLTGKVEHKDQLGLVCIVDGVQYKVKKMVDITIKKQ